MKNFALIFITSLLLLTSCGQLTGNSTGANDLLSEDLIGGIGAISIGSDRYLFAGSANNGGNSGHNYKLVFNLAEGESMEFFLQGTRSLEGAGAFKFTRAAGKVTLQMAVNGKSDQKELTAFENVNPIDIEIDFHNDHTDVHILVWKLSGPHNDAEGCSFDSTCLYNTEDFALDVWLGVGKAIGPFWGMRGKRENVLSAVGPNPVRSNL